MRLELPVTEALSIAAMMGVVPPFVQDVRAEGSTVHLQVDAARVMGGSGIGRFLGGLAGHVPVAARFTGFADGVATIAVTAEARGIPLHRFMPMVEGRIKEKLAEQGLPPGVVEVRTGASDPVIAVDVRRLVAAKVSGVVVTDVALLDATVHVTATTTDEPFRLL